MYLFCFGAVIYGLIEVLFRGFTHWTMLILGGLCFVIIGGVNQTVGRAWPLSVQMLFGAIVITALEFLSGYIVNVVLNWNVWDYSHMPFNIMGQVCLLFSVMWFFLSLPAIFLDDFLRFRIFGEPLAAYRIF